MRKIVLTNLLVLLGYTLAIKLMYAWGKNEWSNLSSMATLMWIIPIHVICNLIMAFSEKENRPSHLLSAFLVLLVGFGACLIPVHF